MKNILYIICFFLLFSSCEGEHENLGASELDISTPDLTALDHWIRENYVSPYNIEIHYAWDENKVDLNRYLYPPSLDKIKPALDAIKTVWLNTYKEVAGEEFVKRIAPREILLVGGINLNSSGTITLGLAEGGKRITFFNTDLLDTSNRSNLIRFVSTIQHEYCHILNQTVPFIEEELRQITPSGYTAQWFNSSISEARELGYISDYARSNVSEDFAEMVNAMLSYDTVAYNGIIDAISSEEAKSNIRKKEDFVVNYFNKEFDIDLYELQRVAAENIEKVLNQ